MLALKGQKIIAMRRSPSQKTNTIVVEALKGRNNRRNKKSIIIMGQSLVKNYIHIIFSTKHRQSFIDAKIETELHSYIGGICNNIDCQSIKVGGYVDHIHILCLLSKNIALAKVVEKIKSHSSKWAKTKGEEYHNFYWQNGYGAFSVNPSEVDVVVSYISNQHEHHRKKTFQEEYRAFLKKYDVEYDERYVWD